MGDFDRLPEEQFRKKMRPHAEAIYREHLRVARIDDLREQGVRVHVLDKEFGIDTLGTLPSGQWVSIQEKYRSNAFLTGPNRIRPHCPDFTQEFRNAVGTEHEHDGEYFHLGAQLYFYGWGNSGATAFEAWFILDIPKYKLWVENAGGLASVGKLFQNRRCGSASFFAIPIDRLFLAGLIVMSSKWHDAWDFIPF